MKTITTIIILLFLSAVLLFGFVFLKKSVEDKKISNIETENTVAAVSSADDIKIKQEESTTISDIPETTESVATVKTTAQTAEETTAATSNKVQPSDSIAEESPEASKSTILSSVLKKIVFVSNKTGNEDIFSINLDGSELTQLTDDPGRDQYPAVSPDGKKIAYCADIGGTWQIVVMNWDGTNKQQITNGPNRHGFPSWSFDGKYIFIEIYMDENWEMFVMDSNGNNLRRLTNNPGIQDWHPGAHPFEYKVIYESGNVESEEIWEIDINGNNQRRISKPGMRYRVPKVSINGQKIVFMGYDDAGRPQIFMMDYNGENVIQITDLGIGAGLPSFSPDNKLIAFNSNAGAEIFIMNIDGTSVIQLTNLAGDDWGAVFMYQK